MPRPTPRLFLLLSVMGSAALAATAPRTPQAIVTEHCAGCHGAVLTGANGPNLLDGLTNHGNDDANVRKSIVEGWPANGMPAFAGVLTDAEITDLVAFIRKQRGEFFAGRLKAPVPPDSVTLKTERMSFRLETWIGGLDTVWGLAFLPGGGLVFTEREGKLRVVSADGKLQPEPVRGLPKILVRQDGGLLDVIAHPRYAENGWLYLAYSETGDAPNRSMTVVVRGKIRDGEWTAQQDIFRMARADYVANDTSHYGCRFFFDPAGYLFFTLGERGQVKLAQDLSSPLGKIHRVFDDGRVPPDNPFVGRAGAVPSIWSYGHRHPQGLALHPVTGKLWATEHGPRGGDELNRIEPGRNYGWPLISRGLPQFGETIGGTHGEGLEQPQAFWALSVAPNAIEFSTSDRYPAWKNHLLMATLVGEHLRRIETDGDRVVHEEILFQRYGRVRDVVSGPDGLIYVALNSPGRIARLIPVD